MKTKINQGKPQQFKEEKARKLPRARIMWAAPDRLIMCKTPDYSNGRTVLYALLPTPDAKTARQVCAVANMTREQRVRKAIGLLKRNRWMSTHRETARSIDALYFAPQAREDSR